MVEIFFNGICDDARHIREEVFIKEQGFKDEFDAIDKWVDTLVIYDDKGEPMATGRVYEVDKEIKSYQIGRIAVLKKYRKSGLGTRIIKGLESKTLGDGAKVFMVSAQLQAVAFYNKCGYTSYGKPYFEEHVPHIAMKKVVDAK